MVVSGELYLAIGIALVGGILIGWAARYLFELWRVWKMYSKE